MRNGKAAIFFLTLFLAGPASAGDEVLLPVPARIIQAGESLVSAQMTMKLFHVSFASRQSYVFHEEQLLRMEAAHTLVPGKPIALRSLRLINDVEKGRLTKTTYVSGAIEIEGMLLPLASGSAGQFIEARNLTSHEVVKALVQSDGTLVVGRR